MASPRGEADSTPICRCRVLYLGSAVPHVTKDGLQGIQEPLRELYPEQGALGARGIDSWLSVWSNGLLLENVDENHKKVTRFFPIDTLHYCAAVRYVLVPEKLSPAPSGQPATPRFLPLDSPFARSPNPSHPPLFAAILRRTTGIKVLECHTFICKREMAANALVRCCFHAYADSSYAKHMDGGGGTSVYGTLRSHGNNSLSSNTIDKVEGWRQMSPTNGDHPGGSVLTLSTPVGNQNGTLTSNATAASNDDLSIYNGDENHKVWAGPHAMDRADDVYGSATMRSARSSRPRQMVTPVMSPPPPPPPTDPKGTSKKANKDRNRRRKMMGGSREDLYPLMNGSLMRGAPPPMNGRSVSSLSGTLMKNQHHHYNNGTILRPTSSTPQHHPGMNAYHHPHTPPILLVQQHPSTLPHPKNRDKKLMMANTFSYRPKMVPGRSVMPPQFIPMIQMPPPHAKMMPKHRRIPPPPHIAVEEPIYMPSARPLSPIASFQPAHFPHEAYLMQQHASTMDGKHRKKSSKGDQKTLLKKQQPAVNGGGTVPDHQDIDSPSPPLPDESPFNTGIYRKKGHLNERAFSYSIRQEHRSRSYGSLANLKFATPIPNGGGPPPGHQENKEEMKKEREIMQMMHDLELSGDELERSEVPQAIYESRKVVNPRR